MKRRTEPVVLESGDAILTVNDTDDKLGNIKERSRLSGWLYLALVIGFYVIYCFTITNQFIKRQPKDSKLLNSPFILPPNNPHSSSETPQYYPIEDVLSQVQMHDFFLSDNKRETLEVLNSELNLKLSTLMTKHETNKICKKYGFQPRPVDQPYPKIFYGALFNTEIDMLIMSLYEMADLIYSYVLVEANATFMGKAREMQFPRLMGKLSEFSTSWNSSLYDKIVYHMWAQVGTAEYYATADTPMPGSLYYGREEAMRDSVREIWLSLGLKPSDIVIISDSDEFIKKDFLLALKVCEAFPEFQNIRSETFDQSDVSYKTLCMKNKIQVRSFIFSFFLDCPQLAKYGAGSNLKIWPGIRFNWHPDAIPGFCLLNKAANTSVENIRTRGGSKRITARVNGWHFRNSIPHINILKKYQSYSHPGLERYNISAANLNLSVIQREMLDDCAHRSELLRYISPKKDRVLTVNNMPSILFSKFQDQFYKSKFYNVSDFYDVIRYNTKVYGAHQQ